MTALMLEVNWGLWSAPEETSYGSNVYESHIGLFHRGIELARLEATRIDSDDHIWKRGVYYCLIVPHERSRPAHCTIKAACKRLHLPPPGRPLLAHRAWLREVKRTGARE